MRPVTTQERKNFKGNIYWSWIYACVNQLMCVEWPLYTHVSRFTRVLADLREQTYRIQITEAAKTRGRRQCSALLLLATVNLTMSHWQILYIDWNHGNHSLPIIIHNKFKVTIKKRTIGCNSYKIIYHRFMACKWLRARTDRAKKRAVCETSASNAVTEIT
jgi:hypothetical protein